MCLWTCEEGALKYCDFGIRGFTGKLQPLYDVSPTIVNQIYNNMGNFYNFTQGQAVNTATRDACSAVQARGALELRTFYV